MSPSNATLENICQILRPDWSADHTRKTMGNGLDVSLSDLFETSPEAALSFTALLGVRLLAVKLKSCFKVATLLFDGRYADNVSDQAPVRLLVVSPDGKLATTVSEIGEMPTLFVSRNKLYGSFRRALDSPVRIPTPRNPGELERHFQFYPLPRDTSVIVSYLCYARRGVIRYGGQACFGDIAAPNKIFLRARPGKRYNFEFSVMPIRKSKQKKLPQPRASTAIQNWDVFKKNRSAATKLFRKNLNFAYDLGAISKQELIKTSSILGKTTSALVCGFNRATGQLAKLAYVDRSAHFETEIGAGDWSENEARFFDLVEKRYFALRNERLAALEPALSRLHCNRLKTTQSLFDSCRRCLLESISRQLVITYYPTDEILHHLRFVFAKYVATKNGSHLCRMRLRMSPQNDICSFKANDFHLFNACDVVEFHACETFKEAMSAVRDSETNPTSFGANARRFGDMLLAQWETLAAELMRLFNYDINGQINHSLVHHGHQALMSRALEIGGPFYQGAERLKPLYSEWLRSCSKGGFIYSNQCTLASGDSLSPDYNAVKALEVDLVSAYGYSAAKNLVPGGFCVGLISPDFQTEQVNDGVQNATDPTESLLRRADSLRSESFEFKAVFYTLFLLSTAGKIIKTVYSNFHALGVFYVKKCFLDLAVIFEDGQLLMANFDSQFTHGCAKCDPLLNHVNGESGEALVQRSRRRDDIIASWLVDVGLPLDTYRVVTDCHDKGYSHASLARQFKNVPQLKALVQTAPKNQTYTTQTLLDFLNKQKTNRDFTYVAWITGSAQISDQSTPVVREPIDPNAGNSLSRETGKELSLVTREYFEYLMLDCGFAVERIHAVLFFGVDKALSSSFEELVSLRTKVAHPGFRAMLKNMANMTVGYLGINFNKTKSKYFITNRLPVRFFMDRYEILSRHQSFDEQFITYAISPAPDIKRQFLRNNSLAAHVSIVGNAKLRLVKFINFLQRCLVPGSFLILYSNVDNLHLGLGARTISRLVAPDKGADFDAGAAEFFNRDAPGSFQIKWQTDESFRYATAKVQNFAILSYGCSDFKCAGVNEVDAEAGYAFTTRLLDHMPAQVMQKRRVCKPAGLETAEKAVVFHPPKGRPPI